MQSQNCPSEGDPQANGPGNNPARQEDAPTFHVVSKLDVPEAVTDEYRAGERKKERRDRRAFVVNVLTLLAVVAATVFTGLSLRVTRDALQHAIKTSADSDKDTKAALAIGAGHADAAKKNADAAEKSAAASEKFALEAIAANNISRQQLERARTADIFNYRAWVSFDSIDTQLVTDQAIKMSGAIQNWGRSPALDVSFWCRVSIVPAQQSYTFPWGPTPVVTSSGIVGPNSPRTSNCEPGTPVIATTPRITMIKSGGVRLYIYGVVTYRDPLGTEGNSGFCAVYHPVQGRLIYCNQHSWMR